MSLPRSLDELVGLRAARWVRESTRGQYDRFGPDAQREQQDQAIGRWGLIDSGIAWNVAHSGRTIGTTSQWAAMLETAGRDFDVLVVGYVSRFARDLRTAVNARHDLHRAGAAVLFCDERIVSSDEDAWEAWAREAVEAESYSRRLSRRIREGYAAKRRRHHDQGGGLVPVGFRRVDRLAEPDPATMPAVLRAYRMAADGMTDAAIAGALDLGLWQVRTMFRSPLYAGRLTDGTPTRFPAPIPLELREQAQAQRERRTRSGHQSHRHRVYPLTDRGPLLCANCQRFLKGAYKNRHQVKVYRHPDKCADWPQQEYRAGIFDEQVAWLLRKAAPNRESAAAIRAALRRPPVEPDRLALARIDAELRQVALGLVRAADPAALARLEELRQERQRVAAEPAETDTPDADEALTYLADLGKLWRDTSDEGRRALAVGLFSRLGAVGPRIVDVEPTPYAERRGLALALPTRVTVVGDTGLLRGAVTWPIHIEHRREWLAASRQRSA